MADQIETKAKQRTVKVGDHVHYILPKHSSAQNFGQHRLAFVTNVLDDGKVCLNVQIGHPKDFSNGNNIPGYGSGRQPNIPSHIFSVWSLFGIEHGTDENTWHWPE